MVDLKVIDFCQGQLEREKKKRKKKEEEYAKAYAWALEEQQRNRFLAQPIKLEAKKGEDFSENDNFVMSCYYDKESKKALIRRDWKKELIVQYNILTNFEELKENAPDVLETLLENGVRLAKTWDN